MRIAIIGSVVALIALSACNVGVDKTWRLTPVENVQFYFETLPKEMAFDSTRMIKEKRGNVLLLNDVGYAARFLGEYKTEIFVDPSLKLVWDTLNAEKKLFLVDSAKALNLDIEGTSKVETEDGTPAILFESSPKLTDKIGPYIASHIGKEIILINDKGFVGGARQIGRDKEGRVILKAQP